MAAGLCDNGTKKFTGLRRLDKIPAMAPGNQNTMPSDHFLKAINACLALVLILLAISVHGCSPQSGPSAQSDTDKILQYAFEQRARNLQVEGRGVVRKLLSDDLEGSKHQRFILQLDSGQTLLISHNIDIAPRLPDLQVGNKVSFYGVYEWNPEGGVIHWTHHDPQGRHPGGWLKHNKTTYQ